MPHIGPASVRELTNETVMLHVLHSLMPSVVVALVMEKIVSEMDHLLLLLITLTSIMSF